MTHHVFGIHYTQVYCIYAITEIMCLRNNYRPPVSLLSSVLKYRLLLNHNLINYKI